jgi:hypothetical protein
MQKDLVGCKFGLLTVRECVGRRKGYGKSLLWLCDCECGGTTSVPRWFLLKGIRKACGNNIHKKRKRNWKGHGDLGMFYFSSVRRSAKERKILFDITIEYAWELFVSQEKRCALTGVELVMETDLMHHHNTNTASLDRINSADGYVEGNVQWVHKVINFMKQALTESEFVEWCRLIVAHQEKVNNGLVISQEKC